ncbi:MAG: hypothetical protein HY922_16005 [Elusimicrobia bacterium]|nr:hypothetical protein [Elusimicrobiota bacterium]
MRLLRRPAVEILALAALTLAFGLWGIGWDLPSKERLDWVLPPGLDGPQFHRSLQESWKRMHEMLGENPLIVSQELTSFSGIQRIQGGWKTPPPLLVNPVRSFYLRSAHDDEQTFLLLFSKMRPKQLDFRPRMYMYGGGYLYPLGAWIGASALLGLGRLSHGLSAYFAEPGALAGLYLSGRLFSLAAWLAVVLYVWLLGRRLLGSGFAFLAALICALSPGALIQAHVMKQHTLWPLWALAAFHASLLILEGGSSHVRVLDGKEQRRLSSAPLRLYAGAGTAAGLAAGTFSLAIFPCLFPAAAALLRILRRGAAWRAEARGLGLAALAAIAAFFLANPYWLADIPQVAAEFAVLGGYSTFSAASVLRFLAIPLRLALGWPLELAALLGLLLALRSKNDRMLLLGLCFVCSLLPLFLSAAAEQGRGIRYCMSSVCFAALLAVSAAETLQTFIHSIPHRRLFNVLLAAAFLHLGLHAAAVSRNFAVADGPGSTYRQAGLWLEEHVGAKEWVGLWELPRPANAPYFRLDRLNIVLLDWREAPKIEPKDLPEWIVCFQAKRFRPSAAEAVLAHYESVRAFESPALVPWMPIHWSETTANPLFEIYRKRSSTAVRSETN